MKKIIWVLLVATTAFTACGKPQGFSPEQQALIGTDREAGPMRLWVVTHPEDARLLRTVSEAFSDADLGSDHFQVLKERMLATVQDPANPGVGIAAPQVGILKRGIFVQRFDKEGEPFEFYINPVIEDYQGETTLGGEGCLSVPERSGIVPRASEIRISYRPEGSEERTEETITGFTAVIFQHEIDHLDGILYIDRQIDESTLQALQENGPKNKRGFSRNRWCAVVRYRCRSVINRPIIQ